MHGDGSGRLPRWDLSRLFPGLTSRPFAAAREELGATLTRLIALYDLHGVRAGAPHPPSPAELAAVDEILSATNAFAEQNRKITAYLHALVTSDCEDHQAARALSNLEAQLAGARQLDKRLEGWVATLGAEALIAGSPAAAEHAYPLRRAEAAAGHQMSEAEEGLLAELAPTGGTAWGWLHGDLTAGLRARLHWPDGPLEVLPVSVVRGLATHADRATRRAAYDAELAAWEGSAVALAAALNAIKGETNTVNRRRGWSGPLEPALWANGVDRPTLEAMQAAATASFPAFRRYLRAKSALLGGDGPLAWWDLLAPLGAGPALGWEDATAAVAATFAAYSPGLGGLARRAVEQGWIDADPRAGKQGGAYCMDVTDDESRILMNFAGSWDSVQTLAHELGHAYHNTLLAPRTALQRRLPMALAETASIFCETLMIADGLEQRRGRDRLALLDTDLSGSCQVIVDIHSRFLFETSVFAEREQGRLGAPELCRLMTEAQAASYGDGVDAATYHPWMWAVKSHYYSRSFYNWPYTFGLLFGLGLYTVYREDPDRFRAGYDDLLGATGLADALTLAGRFGIDLHDDGFWSDCVAVVERRIDEFVELATTVAG